MARIELHGIRHSYPAARSEEPVWALEEINQVWEDGSAYALLGPSGCGKTTLLNIISGLISPTEGRVLFDGQEVNGISTSDRHIAQVFQFPVVYDTMTVYDNLAFPLRNRAVPEAQIRPRVQEIAAMLDLSDTLQKRASGLTADGKQKISLGRGLVRPDVNVIMFDEPLTVIDPHLKWQLRSKLKQLHKEVGVTMIYVTHDQTEALTFADRVAVMFQGRVVQVGTPVELFERPRHTFVGHFIGSPGMNLLPATCEDGRLRCLERDFGPLPDSCLHGETLELGVRPEFIQFDDHDHDHDHDHDPCIPVQINKVDDLGRYRVADVQAGAERLKIIVPEGTGIPDQKPAVRFDPVHTHCYLDGWMVDRPEASA